jgi:hypothetical protein
VQRCKRDPWLDSVCSLTHVNLTDLQRRRRRRRRSRRRRRRHLGSL